MNEKNKTIILGKAINIQGSLPRHEIVQEVVNTFIKTEHDKKGKGIAFKYPVEKLKDGQLFILRPGHKKNFDFKVSITEITGLKGGTHEEIAMDLRKKKNENPEQFKNLSQILEKIYHCTENNVGLLLENHPKLDESFQTGVKCSVLLKIIKWLFIMEDIIYWDVEGRSFLYNFLNYVVNETNENQLKEAIKAIKDPSRLKSFIKKTSIRWVPYES